MRPRALLFFIIAICPATLHGQIADFNSIDFSKADSIAALYPHHSLNDLKILSLKLTKPLSTEAEKFRAIYKWICNNIDNDYALYLKNKQNRTRLLGKKELDAWNKKFTAQVFKNLLEKQTTVCTGYAYLVKELAQHAGLACVIVNGYGRTIASNIGGPGIANHSWNAIQLNNKWYLCDATWSGGAYDSESSAYVRKFDAAYFLANPAYFVRKHYPLDTAWMLLHTKPTLPDFLNGPIVYSSAINYEVQPLFPQTFDVTALKGEKVSFRFVKHNNKVLGKVKLQVERSATSDLVNTQTCDSNTVLYSIDHTFSTRGTYAVHILLDDNYVFSYDVKVK